MSRIATRLAVIALLLSLAACRADAPPPNLIDMPPSPPTVDVVLGNQLDRIGAFPVSRVGTVYPPSIDLSRQIGVLHTAWSEYVEKLAPPPAEFRAHTVRTFQRFDYSPVTACRESRETTWFREEFYCPAATVKKQINGGVIVLPVGFADRLTQLAANNPYFLVLVDVIASMWYQDHLTFELSQAGYMWPNRHPYTWCVAGISLRALTARVLTAADASLIIAFYDKVVGSSAGYAYLRAPLLLHGYQKGTVKDCVAYSPATVFSL